MAEYKVALGGRANSHSFIIKSPNGLDWENVAPDLETILRSTPPSLILDFSLGSGGDFYISYRERGLTVQKKSSDVSLSMYSVARLVLGPEKSYWAELCGVPPNPSSGRSSIYKPQHQIPGHSSARIPPKAAKALGANQFPIVALGAKNYYFYSDRTSIETNLRGLSRMLKGPKKGRPPLINFADILDVAISTWDPGLYLCIMRDGSMEGALPKAISAIFSRHFGPVNPAPSKKSIPSASNGTSFVPENVPRYPIVVTPSIAKPLQTTLVPMGLCFYSEFCEIAELFSERWTHPGKSFPSRVRRIFKVDLPPALNHTFKLYRESLVWGSYAGMPWNRASDMEEKLLFHGTRRKCTLGDEMDLTGLCNDNECCVCSILRSSFSVKCAGTAPGRNFLRFGHGIYTTSVSSKAHDYTAAQLNSPCRVMIVARVVLGNGYRLSLTTSHLTAPPAGYNSVIGVVGMHLNYDEQVVYTADAIRPAYLIVYEP